MRTDLNKGKDDCSHTFVCRGKERITIAINACVKCGKVEVLCDNKDIDTGLLETIGKKLNKKLTGEE